MCMVIDKKNKSNIKDEDDEKKVTKLDRIVVNNFKIIQNGRKSLLM